MSSWRIGRKITKTGHAGYQLQVLDLGAALSVKQEWVYLGIIQECKLYSFLKVSPMGTWHRNPTPSPVFLFLFLFLIPKVNRLLTGHAPDTWGNCHSDFSLCPGWRQGAKESTENSLGKWPSQGKKIKSTKGHVSFLPFNWVIMEGAHFLIIFMKGAGRTRSSLQVPGDPLVIYMPFLIFSYHLFQNKQTNNQEDEESKIPQTKLFCPLIFLLSGFDSVGVLVYSGYRNKTP